MKAKALLMKRILAVFTSSMILTAAATGCNKDSNDVKKTEKGLFGNDSSSSEVSGNNITPSGENGIINNLDTLESTGNVYSQTIMVYMVGSDLESEYGNASLDLQEMQDAMPDVENNNIIVYTGGASKWQTPGIDADENTILKLESNGFTKVSSTESKNMGESETLSEFISYGLENYDTDKYGLVLWNHGAGPVFGFGVDENYNDLLSLTEMQSALENSVGNSDKTLEWIGFDACLMSSLEVADVFSDYSNYLISSQETEPGWGWNYAFLSSLSEPDMDGARLGQKIIDSYMEFGEAVFAEYPKLYSDLTLSCLDLNKYQSAEEELNVFFEQMNGTLDSSTFPEAVRNRDNVKDFGTYSSDFNYSLVDVTNLLELLSADADASASDAISAINDMIMYMRTNVSNAGGVSICYPYQTESEYAEYCIAMQESLDFSSGYTSFLKNFNSIKNGEQIADEWTVEEAETNVEQVTHENGEQNGSDISLALSKEQQQNFGTAAYYILCKAEAGGFIESGEDERAEDMYVFIHGGKNVKMDENGVLHAYYSDNVVYMKDKKTGERSGTPMVLIDNDSSSEEKRYLTSVTLTKTDDGFDTTGANLQIVVDKEYPNGIIRNAVPISSDDEEVRRANKQLLDIDDYNIMSVIGRCSYLTRDENNKILPFFEWEKSGMLMGFEQDLKSGYELEVTPIENPENYVCMFIVTDSQGNSTVSELIPLG